MPNTVNESETEIKWFVMQSLKWGFNPLTGSLPVGQEWPAQGGQRNKICSTPFEHVMIVLQPGITVGVTGGHVGSEMGVQFSRGSDSSKIGVIENHTSKHPIPMIFIPKLDPIKVVNYHYRDVG